MDATDKMLDDPNMSSIPTFALYGEERANEESFLHWETITSRSRLYGFHIAPHRHDSLFQILYLRSGRAELTIDEMVCTVEGPALVTVPALTVHGYRFSTDVDGVVLTFYSRDVRATLAEIPDMAAAFSAPRLLDGLTAGGTAEEIELAVRALTLEADREGLGHLAALHARLVLLLLAIWRADQLGGGRQSKGDRAEALARAYQALVDENFRTTRALGFYADRLGITQTHLNRVCRAVLASSALTVIERRVLLEAKRYLQFSRLSVKEIGILLGYDDPAYFSRLFTRLSGTTPTRFRLQQRAVS